jgi:hypothetical protein
MTGLKKFEALSGEGGGVNFFITRRADFDLIEGGREGVNESQ